MPSYFGRNAKVSVGGIEVAATYSGPVSNDISARFVLSLQGIRSGELKTTQGEVRFGCTQPVPHSLEGYPEREAMVMFVDTKQLRVMNYRTLPNEYRNQIKVYATPQQAECYSFEPAKTLIPFLDYLLTRPGYRLVLQNATQNIWDDLIGRLLGPTPEQQEQQEQAVAAFRQGFITRKQLEEVLGVKAGSEAINAQIESLAKKFTLLPGAPKPDPYAQAADAAIQQAPDYSRSRRQSIAPESYSNRDPAINTLIAAGRWQRADRQYLLSLDEDVFQRILRKEAEYNQAFLNYNEVEDRRRLVEQLDDAIGQKASREWLMQQSITKLNRLASMYLKPKTLKPKLTHANQPLLRRKLGKFYD
jgi:hypothetical protein